MWANRYDPIIAEASRRFNVPQETIRAMMRVESNVNPNAVSSAGAGGLMQVMPATYAELAAKHGLGADRFDPTNNIMAGTAYARQMYDQFGSWDDAFGAYNAGPGRWAQVKAGQRAAPRETQAYIPAVKAAGGGNEVAFSPMIPRLTRPQPGQTAGAGFLTADESKNYAEGLGTLLNFGQEPSQPPRTSPAALPGADQTDRLAVGSRINEILNELLQPGALKRPDAMSPLQYKLAGMSAAIQPLAATRDRKVGLGELLGALGGGLARGGLAADEAQQQQRGDLFGELGKLGQIQQFQRADATAAAKAEAARQYAAQLRATGNPDKIAMADAIERDPPLIDNVIGRQAEYAFPKPVRPVNPPAPPAPVTLGNGPDGPGVYARNPDGTLGPRLGASETGQDVAEPQTVTPEQAQAAGLPAPPGTSPYSNPNLSPRGRSNLVAAQQKSWEKRAADNAEAVNAAKTLVTDMQRFQYLNSQTDTGGITGSPIGGAVRSLYDANVKEMQSITARITPTLRQPGSGATSDFDARMFMQGTVGVDKPRQTNDNIANGAVEAGKNLIAKTQFEQAYFDAYQHTGGMEAAWQRYLNANPIFDPKAPPGSFQLNQNRVDWQTFFRNGEKAPEPGRPQAPFGQAELGPRSGGENGSNPPPPPPGFTVQ